MPGLGAAPVAPSKFKSGGRKSGSLVRLTGEGMEGTGERDALDEVGESGGSMVYSDTQLWFILVLEPTAKISLLTRPSYDLHLNCVMQKWTTGALVMKEVVEKSL